MKKLLLQLALILSISPVVADNISDNIMLVNEQRVLQMSSFWDRLISGFRLNNVDEQLVRYYERRYTRNPKLFENIINNALPYIYYVLVEVERNGMPSEIALLPIVESSYNPFAVSPAGISTGMWQFVAMTGNRFNLTLNTSIDERQDVVKSTLAAIKYLTYLHDLFGRWDLALAGYNWGEGKIYGIVEDVKRQGGSLDYKNLPFRDVTKSYVPKLIALSNIIKNPAKFGVTLPKMDNKPSFVIIKSNKAHDGKSFVKVANIDLETFKKYNPQFKKVNPKLALSQSINIPVANYSIYAMNAGIVPVSNIIVSKDNLNSQNESEDILLSSMQPKSSIKIKTLADIDTSKALAINDIIDQIDINSVAKTDRKIAKISVKKINNKEPKLLKSNKNTVKYRYYKVKSGDTLYSIAKKYNVTTADIKRDNDLANNNVNVEQILKIKING